MRRFQYLMVLVLLAVPLVQLSAAPEGGFLDAARGPGARLHGEPSACGWSGWMGRRSGRLGRGDA